MADDEESRLPGGEDVLGFGSEESEPTGSEQDPLVVDMGAALDADQDALREAAETPLRMEGFETGGGFDLGKL